MGSVSSIRNAIATQLKTAITDAEISARITGKVIVPAILVGMPEEVEYDLTLARGSDRFIIPIRVYAQRADVDEAQATLDRYIDSKSATGIKTVLEADRSLGGVASTLRVMNAVNFGEYDVGNILYLGAELRVEVITQ